MGQVLSTARDEVRRYMKDIEPGSFAISTLELNRIMESLTHDVDSELDSGQVWTTSVITLNPATNPPDYALPGGGVEYQNILDLRRASDNYILARRSQEHISRMRWNGVNSTGTMVSEYALVPSQSGSNEIITVMFDVRPSVTGTIDLLSATALTAFANSDTAVIPFARDFMEGFMRGAAARGIVAMSEAERNKRGLSKDYIGALETAYQVALKKERLRLIRLELSEDSSELNRRTAWWW